MYTHLYLYSIQIANKLNSDKKLDGRCTVDPKTCSVWVAHGDGCSYRVCFPRSVAAKLERSQTPYWYWSPVKILTESSWNDEPRIPHYMYEPNERHTSSSSEFDIDQDPGFDAVLNILRNMFKQCVQYTIQQQKNIYKNLGKN